MDQVQIGKGVHQGRVFSPSLFNFYAGYIMKMSGWMNHKLESRLPGEISPTSNMQMITLMAERKEELKGLLMKVKEESEKVGLKLSI